MRTLKVVLLEEMIDLEISIPVEEARPISAHTGLLYLYTILESWKPIYHDGKHTSGRDDRDVSELR